VNTSLAVAKLERKLARLGEALPEPGLRLVRPLGAGGMGEVFLAEDDTLGEVVVKVMHSHLAPENADRLRMEGEALGRLRSPHIVALHRWGVVNNRPYLVMDRLEGQTLGEVMADGGTVGALFAVTVARDICRGLAVVHDAGIVHRDIKPDNVFWCGERAVLLDFGVVKLLERVTGVQPLALPTADGAAVGTPRYMAPEQARAREVDGRTDLYALGAVLFRMVTGEHVFRSDSLKDLLIAHVMTPPRRASEVSPQPLPPALDAIIAQALEKEPEDRFPHAQAMADALDAVRLELEAATSSPLLETMVLDPDDLVERAAKGTLAMRAPYTHPLPAQPDARPSSEPSPAVTEAWEVAPPPAAAPMVQTEAWDGAAPVRSAEDPAIRTTGTAARGAPGVGPRRWSLPLAVLAALLAFVAAIALAERLL